MLLIVRHGMCLILVDDLSFRSLYHHRSEQLWAQCRSAVYARWINLNWHISLRVTLWSQNFIVYITVLSKANFQRVHSVKLLVPPLRFGEAVDIYYLRQRPFIKMTVWHFPYSHFFQRISVLIFLTALLEFSCFVLQRRVHSIFAMTWLPLSVFWFQDWPAVWLQIKWLPSLYHRCSINYFCTLQS